MEHHGLLNPLDEYHLWALQFVFLPRINKSLNEFIQSWNNHPIRTTGHKSPNQLFAAGAILLQSSNLPGLDFFHEVDQDYGIDTNGPIPGDADTHVEVPESPLHFLDDNLLYLRETVDPCAPSNNHGIDLYEQTLEIILNF